MTRVLVHAGFHKTGTSSLQEYLARHRAALAPWLAYYGKDDFPAAGTAARAFGQRPFAWRRRRFRRCLDEFLAGIPDAPLIVLSRETFAGVMPGHRDWRGRMVTDYATRAVPLGREIAAALTARFGSGAGIAFLFTTREGESWAASVHGHLLRSIELKEDFAAFRARLPAAISLDAEARRIAAGLAPVPVLTAALEDYGDCRLGPAEAVLDYAGVPHAVRDGLPAARRANTAQSAAMRAEFLRLNRSGAPKRRIRAAKARLIEERGE